MRIFDIIPDMKMDFDPNYDAWGWSQGWMFAVCEVMHVAKLDIPEEWEFRASPMLEDVSLSDILDDEDYPRETVADYLSREIVSPDELRYVGNVLSRYIELIRPTKSY